MLDYVWPIALVVTSNVIYQVCAKAVPEAMEPFVFCVVLVGLEVGWIFAYRAGWEVSTANIIQSGVLAAALVVLGCLAYHEALT